jgi:hypothetical protein
MATGIADTIEPWLGSEDRGAAARPPTNRGAEDDMTSVVSHVDFIH